MLKTSPERSGGGQRPYMILPKDKHLQRLYLYHVPRILSIRHLTLVIL